MISLSANRLALGTVQFGMNYGIANQYGQVTKRVVKNMLELACLNGIDTLDTAISYGNSESCLGEVGTKGFKVVTKLQAIPNKCDNISIWVKKQVFESIERLGVSSLYGLLLHRSDDLLKPYGEMLFSVLMSLKADGLVQKIGISIYEPSELDELIPKYKFDIVQAPFNLIDNRLSNSGWLKKLKHNGVEIHTRSTFLQGLLLLNRSSIPLKFAKWSVLWDNWHHWLAEHIEITAVEACLAYPLSFSEIDRVIVGAESVYQLDEIIKAVNLEKINILPDIYCKDKYLINPSYWHLL